MSQFHDLDSARSSQVSSNRSSAIRLRAPVYSVGEPYRRGFRTWAPGAEFACGSWGYELTVFNANTDEAVVDDVRRGDAEFALIVEPALIVLFYRFGQSIPWNDVPFSWHLQPEQRQLIPEIDRSPELRALLWISFVGTDDGIVHAQRGMTLSPGFTRTLNLAIRAQALSAFDAQECTATVSKIFLEYPKPVDRLTLATVRTRGNA